MQQVEHKRGKPFFTLVLEKNPILVKKKTKYKTYTYLCFTVVRFWIYL